MGPARMFPGAVIPPSDRAGAGTIPTGTQAWATPQEMATDVAISCGQH